ncbi:MAG: TetR/AcrR family transcriptional regulator [Polyangiaceae bacterium]|nr:TetR/AcrR family transcriptional regulator [Polyangiaceae bacterium]
MRAPTPRSDESVFSRFFRREPKQSRSRAAVDAVIQATEDLVARGKAIEDLSIELLSERAGVAMGSFYEYFSGKDSVVGVLIGRVTRANFDHLSAALAAAHHETLEALIRDFSRTVVDAYLAHPKRTRMLIDGIARLGLLGVVSEERDRFALEMAKHAMRFLPDEEPARVEATMRLAADTAMGILGFAAHRGGDIDHAKMADELAEIGLHLIRRHHPRASK